MQKRGKLHTGGGQLVIYAQHDEPTDPKQRQNWLPAPQGRLSVCCPFLWALPSIDGGYNMPGVVRKA
jgi:hypothetical protein